MVHGVGERDRMRQLARPGQRLPGVPAALLRIAETEQRVGQEIGAQDVGIGAVEPRQTAVAARLVDGERLLGVAPGGREIAGEELGVGERAAGDQHQPRIVARLGQVQHVARDCQALLELGAGDQMDPAAEQRLHLLRTVAHLPAELPGALVGLPGFPRGEAPRRDQRRAEADLQADLGAVAMRALRELGQHLQRAREMSDRLLGRRARHRPRPPRARTRPPPRRDRPSVQ